MPGMKKLLSLTAIKKTASLARRDDKAPSSMTARMNIDILIDILAVVRTLYQEQDFSVTVLAR